MSDSESLLTGVKVYMTEKEALWHEFEHGFSQQGSSSEGNPFVDVPCARALSQSGAGPCGRMTEEVDSDDIDVVYSKEKPINVETEMVEVGSDAGSHPGEGMLLKNPRSSVKNEDIKLWRYLNGIPSSMEIRVPTVYEWVDWVMPGWVAMYELMLKNGMRFPIPRLIGDMCDHYEIASS